MDNQNKRTYTEGELLKAVEFACNYQKACDYQLAGRILLIEDNDNEVIVKLLDELSDSGNNNASEITIKEIHEQLDAK